MEEPSSERSRPQGAALANNEHTLVFITVVTHDVSEPQTGCARKQHADEKIMARGKVHCQSGVSLHASTNRAAPEECN